MQISDRHGGILIREHEYFADVKMGCNEPTNEVERMELHVLQCMQPQNRNLLQEKYACRWYELRDTLFGDYDANGDGLIDRTEFLASYDIVLPKRHAAYY